MPLTLAATAESLNRHAVVYKPQIQQQLRQGLEFESMMSPRACDNTYSAPNVSVTEVLQAYQGGFTPKGGTNWDAIENKLQKIKIDMVLEPEDLEKLWDSWKVEWYEIGKDPAMFTFPRYVYENHIMPKILEELNTNAWAGVYQAPVAGTPGASINAVDGYKTKIEAAITAGDLTEYATGAFVENTMVNQMETWVDSLPIPYRDAAGPIYMAPSKSKMYYRNYRQLFGAGAGSAANANNELRIDQTKKIIIPINAMEGSNRIMFSPKSVDNMIWGTRRGFPTYPEIRFQYFERQIKVLSEFYRFYGFEFWPHLFVNDQN
jgi:hypothetical protein